MSPMQRKINSKVQILNMLTGNPVQPFVGVGHYFPERVTGGWMLYQNVDGDNDTCLRVANKVMSSSEMISFIEYLLENPPTNLAAPVKKEVDAASLLGVA